MRPTSLSTLKPARLAQYLVTALLLVGLAVHSRADEIILNPVFNISDQSIWGATAPTDISRRALLARVRANGSDPRRDYSFDGTVAGVGLKFGGYVEIDHTFGGVLSMNGGSLDASLPYDIRLSFDESTIATDRQIRFDSSFALDPDAFFSTTTSLPDLSIHHEHWYKITGRLEACFVDCATLADFNKSHDMTGYANRRTLLALDEGRLSVANSIVDYIDPVVVGGSVIDYDGSVVVDSSIHVNGSVAGDSVSGGSSASVLKLDNFKPVQLIPKVGAASTGGFSGNAWGVNVGADWTILSVEVDASLGVEQDFDLSPETPELLLDFGNGFTTSFLAGDSATVDLPEWWTPDQGFTPTVLLDSFLWNTTSITWGLLADLVLPKFNIHNSGCCGSIGPAVRLMDRSYKQYLSNQKRIPLQPQSYTGERVQLASVSVPEPSILVLLASGLLVLLFARRARP